MTSLNYQHHFLNRISVLALLSTLLLVATYYFYDSTPTLGDKYFLKKRNDFNHHHDHNKKVSCSLGSILITTFPTMTLFSKLFYRSLYYFVYSLCLLYLPYLVEIDCYQKQQFDSRTWFTNNKFEKQFQ